MSRARRPRREPDRQVAPAAARSVAPDDRSSEDAARPRTGVFPSLRELVDPRAPFALPLLLLIASRVVAAYATHGPAEDAYITFRYARNFVAGQGLVFNPGERVMGFTSPVWTLWAAAGWALIHDPILWTRVWAGVADAVTLLVFTHLLTRQVSRASAWAFASFFAAWPYFAFVSTSGMEMSLVLALIALGAALAEERRLLTGPVLGALALTRPEGLAAALVLALRARMRDRLVALGVAAAGLAALAMYYGSIVPQSVRSKAAVYGTAGPWAGRYWWDWLSPVVLGQWPRLGDTVSLQIIMVVLSPAFVFGVMELWRRRDSALARAAAALLGVWLGYALLGVTYFWWYLLLPLAGVALAAAVGLPRVVRGRGVYVAAGLFVLTCWTILPALYAGRAREEQVTFGGAARELGARVRPGDKVFLEPIGLIGFFTPVVIVDEIGIVSPRVAARRLQGPGWYTDVVAAERPEWLVVRAGVLTSGEAFAGAGSPFRGPADVESLSVRYETVATSGAEGPRQLMILRRRGS